MTAHRGLRFREDTGWELRCASCNDQGTQSYWPLTREFWAPERGMARCRACQLDRRSWRRTVAELIDRGDARRKYNREWMRRRRAA